jgi:dihydrofolate synthase/folylpolyglutamate synthase
MNTLPGDLAGWLAYIAEQHPKKIELGLARMRRVADAMSLSAFTCPLVTVAGTNGKGSSVAMLESIYHAAGLRVAAYTSPHLTVFNERIRLDRQFCSDQQLIDAFESIEVARQEAAVGLTYFEYATLAAAHIFQRQQPDVVMLEVGLGGRLDATNLFAADVALITQVGLDHMDWLGTDREQIGAEKAGIIHSRSNAVIADPHPPRSVVQAASERAQDGYLLGQHFGYRQVDDSHWQWWGPDCEVDALPLPQMPGIAQLDNASGVLMCVQCLQHRLPLDAQVIRQGIAASRIRGRFEVHAGPPLQILDVAHNADSAALLSDNLARLPVTGSTRAVLGMLSDKDISATVQPMLDQVDEWFVAGLDVPRGASAEQLASSIRTLHAGASIRLCDGVEQAWQQASRLSGEHDRMIAFGSFHTVGAIIELFFPGDQ